MNRLIPLIALVVLVAALTGAAIGWRFPFFGQRRTAQQLDAQSQQNNATRVQRSNQPTRTASNNRTPVQRASQPTTTDQNNSTAAQPTDAVLNPEASGTGQADADQPVPALW